MVGKNFSQQAALTQDFSSCLSLLLSVYSFILEESSLGKRMANWREETLKMTLSSCCLTKETKKKKSNKWRWYRKKEALFVYLMHVLVHFYNNFVQLMQYLTFFLQLWVQSLYELISYTLFWLIGRCLSKYQDTMWITKRRQYVKKDHICCQTPCYTVFLVNNMA